MEDESRVKYDLYLHRPVKDEGDYIAKVVHPKIFKYIIEGNLKEI